MASVESVRAGSARKGGKDSHPVMSVSKIEIRVSSSMAGAGRPPRTGSARSRAATQQRPGIFHGVSRPSSAPRKLPQLGHGKSQALDSKNVSPVIIATGPKVANLHLDVDQGMSNVKMHGSALVRPSSAAYSRPDPSNTHMSAGMTAKNPPKPSTAASMATTAPPHGNKSSGSAESQGKGMSRTGTAEVGSRPGTAWTTDGTVDGGMKELSAIDSEDSFEQAALNGIFPAQGSFLYASL